MTYTIPPDSPKAAAAAEWGAEFRKAVAKRDVSFKELSRVTGIGRTALVNYRMGESLPRTASAYAIAEMLRWPNLRTLIDKFRTRQCQTNGCSVVFHFDGGSANKRYCSIACREAALRQRMAETRARQNGQKPDGRRMAMERRLLKSGLRVVTDEKARVIAGIAKLCEQCEPDGLCRLPSCPVKEWSPFPLAEYAGNGKLPKTMSQTRSDVWTPVRRQAHAVKTAQMHRDGVIVPRGFTPEQRLKGAASNARRSFEDRSRASKLGKTRRAG